MKRSNNYNTKQRDMILKLVEKKTTFFTAKEIYEELSENIGLTTIYRMLDNLEKSEIVKKIYENNMSKYQYLEHCENDNHFYLKCDKCGNVTHADCDCIKVFTNHILKEHNFLINNENVFISGICSNCKGRRI